MLLPSKLSRGEGDRQSPPFADVADVEEERDVDEDLLLVGRKRNNEMIASPSPPESSSSSMIEMRLVPTHTY